MCQGVQGPAIGGLLCDHNVECVGEFAVLLFEDERERIDERGQGYGFGTNIVSAVKACGDGESISVEGAILGNYEPNMNKPSSDAKPLESFLLVAAANSAALEAGLAPPVGKY